MDFVDFEHGGLEAEGPAQPPLLPPTTTSTNINNKPPGWGRRHTLAMLIFWGCAMAYATRLNLTMAIVGMVKEGERLSSSLDDAGGECLYPNQEDAALLGNASAGITQLEDSSSVGEVVGEFVWTPEEQGFVLGSFFWGYVITQLPGGFIATKMGGKWTIGLGILFSGILTLVTPLAARINIIMLIYVRILMGLCQGVVFPSCQTLLAAWAPADERSFLTSIAYSGSEFGASVTTVLTGYLILSPGGWPAIFYLTGALSILWFGFWAYFVVNIPSKNPWISREELKYIEATAGDHSGKKRMKTPWGKILTSFPVWGIILAELGHAWGFYTLLLQLPTYIKTVLRYNIEQDSWLSAMPGMLYLIFANLMTLVADRIIAKGSVRTIVVRKVAHTIAEVGSGLALIGAIYSDCNRTAIVVWFSVAVVLSGASMISFTPNMLDLSPNHAGIIMGLANTVGNFCGFGTALVTGAIIKSGPTQTNWSYVFFIAVGFHFFGALSYILLASSEEQPWNNEEGQGSSKLCTSDPNLVSGSASEQTQSFSLSHIGSELLEGGGSSPGDPLEHSQIHPNPNYW